MKQKILLSFFILFTNTFLFSQSNDTLNFAEISGQINNYKGITPYDSVSVCISSFGETNQFCVDEAVRENGSFQLVFPIVREQDILFFYGDNAINFPFAPNQKVELIMDDKDFKSIDYQPIKISAKGYNQLTINHIIQFLHFYRNKYHYFFKENKQKQIQLDGKDYGDYRIKAYEEHQSFLQEFNQQNLIKDTLFIQWADNKLQYELMLDLHRFMYLKYDMLYDLPPDFYRQLLLKHQKLNRKGAVFSMYYLYGLNYEKMYLNGEFQKSPKGRQLMKEGKPLWEGKLNHLYQNSKGFARDVMISESLTGGLSYPKGRALARKYLELINDDIEVV